MIIGAVLILAVVGGLALYRRDAASSTSTATNTRSVNPSTATNSAPAALLAGANPPHATGAATSRIVIEEFGDLQCPPCKTLHDELKKVPQIKQGQVRFIFRHFPLPAHANALDAARATEAAAMQNKFWEMQDYLYTNQSAWSTATDAKPIFLSYARTLGLDADRFARDMRSPQVDARVRLDLLRGNALGVTGTPTVFFNNRPLAAADTTGAKLRELITAAPR